MTERNAPSSASAFPDKTPSRIEAMFDAIAPRYDLLNHLLSAGLDRRWRDRAVDSLELSPGARAVDLCTGTADVAIALARRALVRSVIGVDVAGVMLRLGLAKVRRLGLERSIHLVRGDATRIPLADGSCDAAAIGFGIRNVAEPDRVLAELARVLRRGGRLAILEFGQPRIPGIRTLYLWYFRYLLPFIGRGISRHRSAYSYLPASVSTFPSPNEFSRMLHRHGFADVRAVPLSLGIVYLFTGERG
jgi:demethylmenaquinone methyltransferase/2-methoxy-6-polyprenyl-1,4-benzoquinol methylase